MPGFVLAPTSASTAVEFTLPSSANPNATFGIAVTVVKVVVVVVVGGGVHLREKRVPVPKSL